ncbi:ATP-binding protein [Sciscionella marina]|uniref:ATP-binding protein n=1 Tax=Sciscionella marina TaxID=508770 RepID=UPI00037A284E
MSVARQLLLLQVVVVVLLVAAGSVLSVLDARRAAQDRAREVVRTVAESLADLPGFPADTKALQPLAEQVRADTGVDFITMMRPDGVRYTHPNPGLIGKRFLGNTAPALAGHTFTETYTGTLGPSMRAVAPVFDRQHRVRALVAVGITIREVTQELRDRLPVLLGVAAVVLVAGLAGSYLVSRRLRRQTRGLAPDELTRMFDYYEGVLHAVTEGLVLFDREGRLALCNDAARALLELDGDPRGRAAAELGFAGELASAVVSAEPRTDEVHVTDGGVLVVNVAPVHARGRRLGTVVTLRDHTELQALTGELDAVRGFAESLRAQAHESANRLHAVVSLVELGRPERAVELATEELATAQQLTDRVVGAVTEPVLAALLLGKSAEANERGVELSVTEDTEVGEGLLEPRELITVLGNLIDNAIDAAIENAAAARPRVEVTVRVYEGELLLRVADSGPGVEAGQLPQLFRRGWTTKSGGRGLGLALVGQVARRRGGSVEVHGAEFSVRIPVERP